MFVKISFVVRRKDFRTPFHVIMIYTKQSTPLAVDNSEMAVIGLSLKWRQPCVCPLSWLSTNGKLEYTIQYIQIQFII